MLQSPHLLKVCFKNYSWRVTLTWIMKQTCFVYITYLPCINQALTNHKNAHNHHKLSTEGSATPLQLYTVNIPLQTSHDSRVRNSVQDHVLPVLPDLPETSVVTVPKLHCPLSVKGFQLLEATINPL